MMTKSKKPPKRTKKPSSAIVVDLFTKKEIKPKAIAKEKKIETKAKKYFDSILRKHGKTMQEAILLYSYLDKHGEEKYALDVRGIAEESVPLSTLTLFSSLLNSHIQNHWSQE